MWIVLASLYSKVREIFAMRPVNLYGEKFVFSVTAQYVVHMLKLQCHYASFSKIYNVNVWIVLVSFLLGQFCYSACTFVLGEICFQCNCSIFHSYVKLQCHYASLGKFYKLNMWIVLASLYSKVRAIFALPCSAVYFYEISRTSLYI